MQDQDRPVLLALGAEARALRQIQAAVRLARQLDAPWIAVHVETAGAMCEDPEQVEVWLREAQRLGATVRTVRAPLVVQGLVETVRETRARALLLGRARARWPWARLGHSTAEELQRRGLDCRIQVIEEDLGADHAPLRFGDTLAALAVLGACTGLTWLLAPGAGPYLALPLFLAGVAWIAHRWGQGLAALASALSALLVRMLAESPRFAGSAERWPNLLVFLLLLLGTQTVTGLLGRLRWLARESHARELHLASLHLLGRALARSTNQQEIAQVVAEHVSRAFHAEAWVLVPEQDTWTALPRPLESSDLIPGEAFLARMGARELQGDPLEPLAEGGAFYLPLGSTERLEGLLRIVPGRAGLPPRTWEPLMAFAVQVALTLGRHRWLEEARLARMQHETERMRSALLDAIGHDLRTPLAAIHGAAGSLLLPAGLPDTARLDLLRMIQQESERLSHLLSNLLDLTRLESGSLAVEKVWQPFEEVVGAAVLQVEREGAEVHLDLPADLPLVPMDAALLQQALIHLLSNARRHSGGAPVELRAWREVGRFLVEVADRGPGIPEGQLERIFEKFFRLPGAGGGGIGLGLSICRAIVRAHGGALRAENREGGGARFLLELPLDGPPLPLLQAEWEAVP